MSIWSLTCDKAYVRGSRVTNISQCFTHKLAVKPASINKERNNVTVTLCTDLGHHCIGFVEHCSISFTKRWMVLSYSSTDLLYRAIAFAHYCSECLSIINTFCHYKTHCTFLLLLYPFFSSSCSSCGPSFSPGYEKLRCDKPASPASL